MKTFHTPLPFRIRADLYTQLAAMETAGMSFDKAFSLLSLAAQGQRRLTAARALLRRRMDFVEAGRRSGLFTEVEACLVQVARAAGSPAQTYRRLAAFYSMRAAQAAALKSRLLLPAFMLIVALLIQPLPALVTGSLSPAGYLFRIVRTLAVLASIGYVTARISVWLRHGPLSFASGLADRWLPRLPLFGGMHVRHNMRDFFESLALLVEAGMPILDALPEALQTITNTVIREEFACVRQSIEQGATLAQALSGLRYLGDERVIALVTTGEGSGTLPEMLFRHAEAETEAINRFHQELAVWGPRLLYGLVLGWIAAGILSGPGVMPVLPDAIR